MEDKKIEDLAYIQSATARKKVMNSLKNGKMKTPTTISQETDMTLNYLSKTLKQLKNKQLIQCLNEESRKKRFYIITDYGKQVINLEGEFLWK